MNLYKVKIEKNDTSRNASDFGDHFYFVIATNYGNAEDKAKNFQTQTGIMKEIILMGEVTRDNDVIKLKDRWV